MAKIVTLGGGTGLSVLLRGLKEVTTDITAVVTVADDGGGSGVLREDLGMLPPGDLRSCILALANQEPVLQDLFHYRFPSGRLKGQNFGNLMIAAMVGISDNFESAIQKVSDIFSITGKVYPVTKEDIVLYSQLKDGSIVRGESNIPYESMKRKSTIEKIWIDPPDAETSESVVESIRKADAIILGPGSLFTSVIPNLLIRSVVEAINSSHAKIFYICNVMTQPGETDGMNASEHLNMIFKHTQLQRVDYFLVNDTAVDETALARYSLETSEMVFYSENDSHKTIPPKTQLIQGPFVEVVQGYVRHDALQISKTILRHVEKIYEP